MTKHTSTRRSLLVSVVALVCCFAMLLGTTFAWFTDSVSSEGNTIQSGTLKVDLLHKDDDQWISLKNQPTHKIFDYAHWEPGYTRVEALKVENLGTLALQYKLSLSIAPGSEKTGPNGENLADVIQVYYTNTDATPANFADIKATWTDAGTLSDVMNSPATFIGGQLTPDGKQGDEQLLTIALHMDENAGNEYQNLSVGNIYVNLVATQWTYEEDSFDENYDKDATFPGEFSASASVSVDDNGEVDQATTVGEQDGIHADIPTGVKMANGATELTLDIKPMSGSQANITLDNGETRKSYDIHIDGMSEDNTVPVQITLPGFMKKGLNTTSVKLYHVENDQTVAMTLVDNPVNHNEFSYDPATGDVVLSTATCSEYVAVTNNLNPWTGTAKTDWYNNTDTEFTLTTAEQLAGFGVLVDSGNTFAGKTIKLGDDIDLKGTVSFNPIGSGYVNGTTNSDEKQGCAFMGTFDGQGYAIRNLYQNGWELGLSYCNLGGGLFASVCDATIQNLTMINANIVMECVEIGTVAGLAQGNCIFKNINIYGSTVQNYNRSTGGVVGEVSQGVGEGTFTHSFENIKVDATTTVSSLWGSFDTACGGVIGGYWDDSDRTYVTMTNVDVACKLDVYNDVTAAYDWYAYRRAGMLIGNTDNPVADGKHAQTATADFLTCKDVVVRYGNWTKYHYCQFTNQDDAWQNNYPWVRAEAGLSNGAYSNARYGNPVVNGVTINSEDHTCTAEHLLELQFNQLYGGGQGVYGQTTHDGVTLKNYVYSITYINNSVVLDTIYVDDNSTERSTKNDTAASAAMENITGNITFSHWMNAGSTKIENVPAGNTEDVKLYPSYTGLYTATFVDQAGNILNWTTFTTSEKAKITSMADSIYKQGAVITDELTFDYWEVHVTDSEGNTTTKETLSDYTLTETDITLYPVYTFNGDVNLIPVDSDGDGIINYYQVGGYSNPNGQAMVEIPASVNGIPILQINEGAFSGYDGVHSIVVPNGVTIQKNAFTSGTRFGSGEEITIYFEGTRVQWDALTKEAGWNYGIGTGSRVFFLKDGKVDTTQGYLEVIGKGGFIGIGTTYSWSEETDFSSVKSAYTGTCNCDIPTTGDTAHVYKDANGNIMNHNDEGTPVGNNGNVITFKAGSWGREDKLTDGTTDTYKRYRPDAAYWEDVNV